MLYGHFVDKETLAEPRLLRFWSVLCPVGFIPQNSHLGHPNLNLLMFVASLSLEDLGRTSRTFLYVVTPR
jgi:hypothetical protein